MGIFKKLRLNRKYIVTTSKDYFVNNVINDIEFEGSIKEIEHEKVTFYSNKKYDSDEVICINRYQIFSKKYLKQHFIGFITMMLVLIILFTSKYFIREIVFENDNYYSKPVYEEVLNHLEKIGPFYIIKDSVNDISSMLRKKFPEYAWIGITRISSKIIIEIDTQDVPIKHIEDLNITGDIVSTKDAVISDIIVSNGIVLVTKNQSVKKGDTLVSGNLNYYNDANSNPILVKSKGIIIGNTITLEKIKVPTKTISLEYSGLVKSKKYLELFGSIIGKTPKTFENYKTKKQEIFNLFNIIKITNLNYYELVEVITEYDEITAYDYAKTLIKSNLEVNRVSKLEKIESITLVDITKEDDYFIVSMVVKRYQNIGVFIQH